MATDFQKKVWAEIDKIPYGSTILIKDGQELKKGDIVCQWDPYNGVIISEFGGKIEYENIEQGITYQVEIDEQTGFKEKVISESRNKKVVPTLLINDVKGKNVILVDDMIDTGGTLAHAANLMKERGALSVRAICTHPILSGGAYEKIENSALTELIVSDTIPLKKATSKIKVVSCAPLFADVMQKVQNNTSISGQFLM